MRGSPDPFSRIPFGAPDGFRPGPPSSLSSAVVLSPRPAELPGILVRAARAAGLACDAEGEPLTASVALLPGGQVASCRRSARRAHFTVGRERVARSPFGKALREECAESMRRAGHFAPGGSDPFAAVFSPGADEPTWRPARVLLFENLFADTDNPRPQEDYLACGTLQLASSLRAQGHEPLLQRGRLSAAGVFTRREELLALLARGRPDLVCLTLLEACFHETLALARLVRSRCGAFVAVGGPMATLCPEQVAVHFDAADFVARGDGEEVVGELASLCAPARGRGGLAAAGLRRVLFLPGVILRRGPLLAAGHPGRVNALPDLDASPFDVSLLEARHCAGGISLETARGCVRPCVFCTAPGRGRFRGRSPRGIALRLAAYEERLRELFGPAGRAAAMRVQLPDDDFACDPARAAGVLAAAAREGARIASFQASVGDFFADGGDGRVLDRTLIDALSPGLFADGPQAGELAAGPPAGRRRAGFNSFVKLGVESLCDDELRRLGKGYRVEDVRRAVDALDEKSIVHDAYLIAANRKTRIGDIVDTLLELARLKIGHPATFFVRLPVVPFLVTTFPSPAFRSWAAAQRRGGGEGAAARGAVELRGTLRAEGFDEYDYPLAARDLPGDPAAAAAAARIGELFEPDGYYLAPLARLAALLRDVVPAVERERGRGSREASDARVALRRLDDAGRLVLYGGLADERRRLLPGRVGESWRRAAAALLPATARTARGIANHMEAGDPRLVVIPTRDCSLRCRYCPMDKEEGKEMAWETLEEALELLVSSERPSLILQFFGGEALLRRAFALDAIAAARELARRRRKKIGFILSTNGTALDGALLGELARLPVKIEVSVDGPREVHDLNRGGRDPAAGSYEAVERITPALLASGLPVDAIMVVTPDTAGRLAESFAHVAGLGYRRIQVNHALGLHWDEGSMRELALQLHLLGERFFERSVRPDGIELVDLWSWRRPVLLNGEITVDWDGSVWFGNGFLVRTASPEALRAGHVGDRGSFDACCAAKPGNDHLLGCTYPPGVTANNVAVGRIVGSFVRHIRARFPSDFAAVAPTTAPGGRT